MMPSSACGKIRTALAKLPVRVLIVDDEPLVRWSLSTGLRLSGFETDTASSSAEALTLAQQQPHPDVMLLDARLYDRNPATLVEELRLAAPRCRFVRLTTSRQEPQAPPWVGVTIITKPFDMADVVRLVWEAVAPRPRTV